MKKLYFFIGTEAELMKMFLVIKRAKDSGFDCSIIVSGQNDVHTSPFLKLSGCDIDIDLSKYKPIKKGGKEYLKWFIKTERYGINKMNMLFTEKGNSKDDSIIVVHGDTLSTLLGARIARKSGIKYVHVESGLRSYNWLIPFPEEIDRYFSSKYSEINFCPKEEYAQNAEKYFKGESVCTYYNTGIETLLYALKCNEASPKARLCDEAYFVLAIHRQENLANKKYMNSLVSNIETLSKKIHCIFIYHVQTEDAMRKFKIWDRIKDNKNITIIKRLPYIEFIDVIEKSEFVIADGAGNQQEFYYMGKPYLIMRSDFEKNSEGLGHNAKGFENDFQNVIRFYDEYKTYICEPIVPDLLPSQIIVNKFREKYQK